MCQALVKWLTHFNSSLINKNLLQSIILYFCNVKPRTLNLLNLSICQVLNFLVMKKEKK